MMPHPKDVQPDFLPNSVDELLDASSLNTVLDMLAVIDSAEELALLEMLTPIQKRQVWDATPDSLKIRLKRIRLAHAEEKPSLQAAATGQHPSAAASRSASMINAVERQAELPVEQRHELGEEGEEVTAAVEPHEVQENNELEENSELQDKLPEVMESVLQNPLPQVGDRVVLLPKPQLTAAEMKAVWQVVEVQLDHARLEAQALGSRRYPLTWMIVYPS